VSLGTEVVAKKMEALKHLFLSKKDTLGDATPLFA
jgi:hypothetical protein